MICILGNNKKKLKRPCVTVTQEIWDISMEKITEKLLKNEWQSTQRNHKNGQSMTQTKTTKWSVYFETMGKHNSDLVWQSHKKNETVPLR